MLRYLSEKYVLEIERYRGEQSIAKVFLNIFALLLLNDLIFKIFGLGFLEDGNILNYILLDLIYASVLSMLLFGLSRNGQKYFICTFLVLINFGVVIKTISYLSFKEYIYLFNIENYYYSSRMMDFKFVLLLFPLILTGIILLLGKLNWKIKKNYKGIIPIAVIFLMSISSFYLVNNKDIKDDIIGERSLYQEVVENDYPNVIANKLGINSLVLRDFLSLVAFKKDDFGSITELKESSQLEEKSSTRNSSIFENKNLILIEINGLSTEILSEMTFLKTMGERGYNFTNYYNTPYFNQKLNNAFIVNTGLLPSNHNLVSTDSPSIDTIESLSKLFYNQGYKNYGYQTYSDPFELKQNFYLNTDYKGFGNFYKDYDSLVDYTTEYILSEKHTYSHLMLDLNTSNTVNYNASAMQVDETIKNLYRQLDDAEVIGETKFIIYSGGAPLNLIKNPSILDNNVPFIIFGNELPIKEYDNYFSTIDIFPTIIDLFDLNVSYKTIGETVFGNNGMYVVFNDRSWISKVGYYDSNKEEFHLFDNLYATEYLNNYIKLVNDTIIEEYYRSKYILESNYFIIEEI